MIVEERRTRMKHEIIDILVILRMNRTFMMYSRSKGSMKKRSEIDLSNVVQRDSEIFEDNIYIQLNKVHFRDERDFKSTGSFKCT